MENLDVKSTLTTDEALEIGEQIQRIALGALYRTGPLKPENSVFHGGGAIRLAWASDRLSEDLDFLVEPTIEALLEKGVEAARVEIEQRMNAVTPGCTISLRRKKDLGTGTQRYLLRWYHPNREGKVAVKLEFSVVPDGRLTQYDRDVILPGDPRVSPYQMRASLSVPKPATSLADKTIAFAMRQEIKWRDVYDLWFLSKLYDWSQSSKREPFLAALSSIMRIYSYSPADVSGALIDRAKIVEETPVKDIEKEIGRFLPREARIAMEGSWAELQAMAIEHARNAATEIAAMEPGHDIHP